MLRGLLYRLPILLRRLRGMLTTSTPAPVRGAIAAPLAPAAAPRPTRAVVADGVMRTLFADYAEHRRTPRGDEEIGWVLLGYWQEGEAVALAALPAGAERDASASHVHFNAGAQELACRILRQDNKRLTVIGVVHTHPGNMRYPSDGDLAGDARWVAQLRTGEAIFGIGTADGAREDDSDVHGELCFSWYMLRKGESRYRPVPVEIQEGADLALPLRGLWDVIEAQATPLNQLCRQLAKVQFGVAADDGENFLVVKIGLANANQQIRLLLNGREARYYWCGEGRLVAVDPHETRLDRAVYLILAELAQEPDRDHSRTRMLVES